MARGRTTRGKRRYSRTSAYTPRQKARYARRTGRRSEAARSYGSGRYGRAAPRRAAGRVRQRRASGAPRTVKIVVEQQAPQTINPLHERLLAAGRVVLPRKAMF